MTFGKGWSQASLFFTFVKLNRLIASVNFKGV